MQTAPVPLAWLEMMERAQMETLAIALFESERGAFGALIPWSALARPKRNRYRAEAHEIMQGADPPGWNQA